MKKTLLSLVFTGVSLLSIAQNNIGIGTNSPNTYAKLDITASDKGLLIPRMTTVLRNALTASLGASEQGLIVFDTDLQKFFYWDKNLGVTGNWNEVKPGSLSNGKIWIGDASNIAVEQTASGDATISNTGVIDLTNLAVETSEINNNAVDGTKINIAGNTNGSLMYYNGSNWVNIAPGTSGQVLKSNGAGAPTWVNASTLGVTNTLTNPTNTITSTVNGVSATAPAVNAVSNTSTTNTLSTTVNGVAGTGVNIINSNTINSATNTMTSNVNGVSSNTPIINTNTLTVSAGSLTSTVNGVASTPAIDLNASIVKKDVVPNTSSIVTVTNGTSQVVGATNVTIDVQGTAGGVVYGKGAGTAAAFTSAGTSSQVLHGNGTGVPSFGAVALTTDVSGVLPIANGGTNSTATPTSGGVGYGTGTAHAYTAAGTSAQLLQSNGTGVPTWVNPSSIAVTHTLTNPTNTITSIVNGVSATAPAVNTVSNTSTTNTLSTTVNGVAGTGVNIINSNSLSSAVNTITSNINGVSSNTPIINTNTLTVSAGSLTSTVNGVATTPAIDLNASLVKKDVVPNTGSVVTVANGTNQVVGATNVTVDVQGTAGGVLYGKGTGTAASFTPAGTTGQILQSGVAGAPTWIDKTSILNTQNGLSTVTTGGSATATTPYAELGGSLYKNTTITQGANNLTFITTATNGFSVDATTFSVDAANDRVGIGTTAPSSKLHVNSTATTTGDIAMFQTPSLASGNASYLKLGRNLTNGNTADIVFNYTSDNHVNNYLGFGFYGSPLRMTFANDGRMSLKNGLADVSALFEADATNRGILIPRVALTGTTDASTIATPATSLMVYNTATAGTSPNNVLPGYYYNSGTTASPVWKRFATGNSDAWSILGNSNTTSPVSPVTYGTSNLGAAENFIGTRTTADVVFGTNNIERMRVLSNGNIGIGTAVPLFKLHVSSGYIGTDYINTTDNSISTGVTSIMAKSGDNFHRSADANAVKIFLNGNTNGWIQNTTTQQTGANFNIAGAGIVGTTMTAPTYLFPALAGDPSPVITARTVPVGQGAANQKTELILFHSNDPNNGSGSDQITLRAPSLSFQTYNNAGVGDINNNLGYNERMYINPDGNVGIGTTNPNAPLQFANTIVNRKIVLWDALNNDHQFYGFGINNNTLRYQVDGTTSNHIFYAGTSTTTSDELMRIQGNGNVGIGNNAPFYRLSVNGTIDAADFGTSGTQNIRVGDDAFLTDLDIANTLGIRSTTGPQTNLSIGTTNAALISGGTENYVHGGGTQTFGSGGQYVFAASHSLTGNVFFETGGFFADGNAAAIWSPGDANGGQPAALLYFIDEDGWDATNTNPYDNASLKSYINAAGAIVNASDSTKKQNIIPISSALHKIMNIGGYEYQFKLAPTEIQKGQKPVWSSGVLAQEVEKQIPTAVEKSAGGDYFVNYSAIIPYLIEGMKEQQLIIEELKKRLELLESK